MRMAPDAWLQDVGKVTQVFQKAAEANLRTPGRSGCVVDLPAKGRATLTGDLHDNYVNFMHVMKLARINYSDQYHVVFQEVIHGDTLYNGNDLSYRTLAKVAKLKMEKPGQVHQLLSNHELSQLTGDGILKDGVSVVEALHGGLQYVFGDAWLGVDEALREYIRTLPLAVRCANGMFVAHSLPSPRQRRDFDPEILKRRITDADRMGLEGSAHIMVWGRGLTQWVADELAGKWGAGDSYFATAIAKFTTMKTRRDRSSNTSAWSASSVTPISWRTSTARNDRHSASVTAARAAAGSTGRCSP